MKQGIFISQLEVGYKGKSILKVDTAQCIPGSITALLGRNGKGKSTLLKTVGGLLPAVSGQVLLDGENATSIAPKNRAKKVSMVFGHHPQNTLLKVMEVIMLGRSPYTGFTGKIRQQDMEKAKEALDLLNIYDLRNRAFSTLSDGEKQKTMIARSVAQNTPAILLDEPTAHLDIPAKMDLLSKLRTWGKEKKKIILFSTHDPGLALQVADYFWLIHEQNLVTGLAEDVVKSGVLSKVFSGEHFSFDPYSGLGRIHHTSWGKEIEVLGNSDASKLVSGLLLKNGFSVKEHSEIQVFIQENGYMVRTKKRELLCNSLQEMLQTLQV